VDEAVPRKIATRVQLELGNYLSQKNYGAGLQVYVGVILCDAAYETAEEILADVDFARKIRRNESSPVLYARDALLARRGSLPRSS